MNVSPELEDGDDLAWRVCSKGRGNGLRLKTGGVLRSNYINYLILIFTVSFNYLIMYCQRFVSLETIINKKLEKLLFSEFLSNISYFEVMILFNAPFSFYRHYQHLVLFKFMRFLKNNRTKKLSCMIFNYS